MIGPLTVTSESDFIVYGEVRGLVSTHRLLRAAQQALEHDQRDRAKLPGGNSYSDAAVYCWDDEDGWCLDVTGEDWRRVAHAALARKCVTQRKWAVWSPRKQTLGRTYRRLGSVRFSRPTELVRLLG